MGDARAGWDEARYGTLTPHEATLATAPLLGGGHPGICGAFLDVVNASGGESVATSSAYICTRRKPCSEHPSTATDRFVQR